MESFVTEILLYIIIALIVAACIMLIILLKRSYRFDTTTITSRLDSFEKAQERTERAVKEEVAQNRVELGNASKEQRLELSAAFKSFGNSVIQRMGELTHTQKGQLEAMSAAIARLSDSVEKKMEDAKVTLEGRLRNIQDDNAKQLEQMRQVVDEKLQGTLEKRLGESFRLVSERLELVHKGLGEMQALATGVGDLKKVLTNVKTRGTWGEVQLGALLEQVLTPEQFATNIATKEGAERVEFAIKLPGQGAEKDDMVYLPIDAKFPIEDYQRLIEAQERADVEVIEIAGRQLEARVKSCAYDICSKYINPPKTTDFAILFLPIEGLFAEVIRRSGLIDAVQRECRVVVAGPTTLWSIMNSLQMGFRTLAIQRRSSEVWNLLAAVKTEWTRYGDILDAVQKKINQASDTIEKARIRSRAVGKKLKDVQELPAGEATGFLPLGFSEDDEEVKPEEAM
jgi:DNA recombination protein RmuC